MVYKIKAAFIFLCFLSVPTWVIGQSSNDTTISSTFADLNVNLKEQLATGFDKDIARAHAELGYYCQRTGVYTEALDQYNKAVVILSSQVHDTLYVDLLNRMGSIHMDLKNYEAAIVHFNKCIDEATLIGAQKTIALAKSNLGSCYEKQGYYDEALKYQEESLQLYVKLNNAEGISLVNENIGSIYEDLEEFDKARSYFETALKYQPAQDTRRANILNNLGDVYRKTGDVEKGLHFTSKSLEIAKLTNSYEAAASAHKDLSKTYHLLGDGDKAYIELTAFLEIDEQNKAAYKANQATALQIIYDINEKQTKIEKLLHESEINTAQKYILICIIVSLGIIGFVCFLYLKRKRQERQKEASYEKRLLEAELESKRAEEISLQKEVQLKNSALSRYSLHLAQKNKMLSSLSQTLKNSLNRSNIDLKRKLNSVVSEIEFNLAQEDEWDEFMAFFNEIHPDYLKQLNSKALQTLSPAELRLSILLRLNLSSKEIASILRLTPDSVRVSRYRLRKKLPIDSKEELSSFLMGI
ncbi:tetratricopeptide repeat protein [Zobellia russellii]|uniref:tetratricopeptide repeat protein n=1 Tax=Zobellia russellii TaxID=248907 RepID=UPI0037DDDBAA